MRLELTRSWIISIICLIITGYFAFHSIQGARGYRRMKQIEAEIVLARQIGQEMQDRKNLLSRKVQGLSPTSLDLDLLEETATRILNMGSQQDRIILLPCATCS